MKKFFLFTLMSILFLSTNYAQVKISGELRTRTEVNHGSIKLPEENTPAAIYTAQRSRLNLDYKAENLTYRISFQATNAWGDQSIVSKTGVWSDSISFSLKESWVNIKFNEYYNLKLGRQYLKYDSQKLLSWRNWNHYALAYDAALLKYAKNGFSGDLGLSWNSRQDRLTGTGFGTNDYYDDGRRMKSLNFMYLKKTLANSYLSFSFINTIYQKPGTSDVFNLKYTMGSYYTLKAGNLSFRSEFYYQFGEEAAGNSVESYMYSGELGFTMGKFKPSISFDVFSGNDDSEQDPTYHETNHAFDNLYGAGYIYNGSMNQFIYLPSSTKGAGLVNPAIKIEYTAGSKSKLSLQYHYFLLQNNLTHDINSTEFYDKKLGSEIDLAFSHSFNPQFGLSTGISYYITSETMEALKLGNFSDSNPAGEPFWFYVMLTFKPVFLNQ